MNPYYEHDGITIYHGDCREILPALDCDVVVTDPPYGLGHRRDPRNAQNYSQLRGSGATRFAGYAGKEYPRIVADDEPFDPGWLLEACASAALFGANYYADRLPSHRSGWLVWDKRSTASGASVGSNMFGDAELIWVSWQMPVRVFRHLWMGLMRASEIGEHLHPTQKPVALMRWVLGLPGCPGGVVADPYMGSGSTLRAAKDLGRKAVGVEIEERYCEIAANRLGQEVLDFA